MSTKFLRFPKDSFQTWYWFNQYGCSSSRGEWVIATYKDEGWLHSLVEAAYLEGCNWLARESLQQLAQPQALKAYYNKLGLEL